jgi:uncharacterized protein
MIVHRVTHNRRRLPMHVHICETRFEKGRGLLLRPCPDQRTAYLLRNCRAIHTVGMRYAVDVLFCDDHGRILKIVSALRPFRFARDGRASIVWELRAGRAATLGWQVGDEIVPC